MTLYGNWSHFTPSQKQRQKQEENKIWITMLRDKQEALLSMQIFGYWVRKNETRLSKVLVWNQMSWEYRRYSIVLAIGTVKVFGLVTWAGSCSAILRFWFDNLIWSLIDDKSKMKYQIIDFMIVLLMADQNKLKPYLYKIPSINSNINFWYQKSKATHALINALNLYWMCYELQFWCVGLWWSWVAGTTAQLAQRRISECVGGWVAVAGLVPGRDRMRGSYPRPQSSTVNSHKVFRPRPRHCRLLLG